MTNEDLKIKENIIPEKNDKVISINTLSELTGFPKDFIKSELLLEKNNMSLEELRSSVISYLDVIQ